MMKTLLSLVLLLSGCGFSYQFQPFERKSEVKAEDVAKALQQRDRALEVLAKRIEALEPKKKEVKK